MKLQRYVQQGEMLPRWYGVAWREMARDGCVAYPIPLNLIFAFLRWVYILCKCPPDAIMADPREAYWQGRLAERKDWQDREPWERRTDPRRSKDFANDRRA